MFELYKQICNARQKLLLSKCFLPYTLILPEKNYNQLKLSGYIKTKKYNKGKGPLFGICREYLDDMKIQVLSDKEMGDVEFLVVPNNEL